jgi:hypothetical protein
MPHAQLQSGQNLSFHVPPKVPKVDLERQIRPLGLEITHNESHLLSAELRLSIIGENWPWGYYNGPPLYMSTHLIYCHIAAI